MTIEIKHPFVSAKGDGGDATLVRPSNWNAIHSTSMATLKILGRLTAGVGAFEELPTSAYMIAALAAADRDALLAALNIGAFDTGDIKMSFNPTAASGWLAYNGEGTISKAGSGGTVLASAAAQPLWEILYNNVTDTYCPVSGGRTANAVNDFNAGKTMALPRFSGRSLIGAGQGGTFAGAVLSNRLAGMFGGAETHTLTIGELATHQHINALVDTGHQHSVPNMQAGGVYGGTGGGTPYFFNPGFSVLTSLNNVTGISITNAFAGSSTPHNNMQPYVAVWVKVKL